MSVLSPSSRVELRSNKSQLLPRKEEWALIYDQKAREYEKLKQLEKQRVRSKKDAFKRDLDIQISGKNDVHKQQKQEDIRYYEYITKNTEEMREKQQSNRIANLQKRRVLAADNKHTMDEKYERSLSASHGQIQYKFEIGLKSEQDRKIRQQIGKKTIIDELDKQVHYNQEQKKMQLLQSTKLQQNNIRYQDLYHLNRNRGRKSYGQNPKVYQHYQNLTIQKERKQKQLEHRLVDDAAARMQEVYDKRKLAEGQRKEMMAHQMQESLDEQVRIQYLRKSEELRMNPEEHSYSVIGSMFREKARFYDKRQYMDFLDRQADEQRRKRNSNNHMNQEEYRLNLNQLNKAVTGKFSYEHYYDRSLNAIGEKDGKMNQSLTDTVTKDYEDAEIVKNRVDSIRNRKKESDDDRPSIF